MPLAQAELMATGQELLFRAHTLALALERRVQASLPPPANIKQNPSQPREESSSD